MTRVAVIGDVGGHAEQLSLELARLGVPYPGGPLPADLIVVQVGDLIHKGPDSERVIWLVDRYLNTQPAQWIQLAGNHEAHYLDGPTFKWDERLSRRTARVVRRWWRNGQARAAAAIRTQEADYLVTHAGVTALFWRKVLDAPSSASIAAQRLNALARCSASVLFRAGNVLHGGRPDPLAGPLWADCATELVPSWLHETLPFSQIHGHTTMTNWAQDSFGTNSIFTSVNPVSKHEYVRLSGGQLIGVDPGHTDSPILPWASLVLPEADVVTPLCVKGAL